VAKAYLESFGGKKLVPFQEWFDPYNPQHIEWARQYLTEPNFDWETVCPNTPDWQVYPLGNCYGIREHILQCFATCWIMWKIFGVAAPVATH